MMEGKIKTESRALESMTQMFLLATDNLPIRFRLLYKLRHFCRIPFKYLLSTYHTTPWKYKKYD